MKVSEVSKPNTYKAIFSVTAILLLEQEAQLSQRNRAMLFRNVFKNTNYALKNYEQFAQCYIVQSLLCIKLYLFLILIFIEPKATKSLQKFLQ